MQLLDDSCWSSISIFGPILDAAPSHDVGTKEVSTNHLPAAEAMQSKGRQLVDFENGVTH